MQKVNEFIEHFEFIQLIGSGSFADVWLAKHQLIDEMVGIKIINKKKFKNTDFDQDNSNEKESNSKDEDAEYQINFKFLQEINMMELIKPHPFIIKLYNFTETPKYYNIIIEYCVNGNLAEQYIKYKDRINLNSNKTEENENIIDFSDENEIKRIFVQIIRTVIFLHDKCGIAHRDLKAENILLDENMNIKIIDFGLSCKIVNNCTNINDEISTNQIGNNINNVANNDTISRPPFANTRYILDDQSTCGPPNYIPPEMILKNVDIGDEVDTWMLGTLLYFLIYGCFPYKSFDVKNLISEIAYLDYTVPETRTVIQEVVKTVKSNNISNEHSKSEEDDDDELNFLKLDMFSNYSKKKKQQEGILIMDEFGSPDDDSDDDTNKNDTKNLNDSENEKVIQFKEIKVNVSPSCRDLIKKMLCKDPLRRISLHNVIKHEWILEAKHFMNEEEEEMTEKNSNSDLEQELKQKRRQKSKMAAKLATIFAEISDSDLFVMENIPIQDVVKTFFKDKEIPFDIAETEKQMNDQIYNDNTTMLRILLRNIEKKKIKNLIDSLINEK